MKTIMLLALALYALPTIAGNLPGEAIKSGGLDANPELDLHFPPGKSVVEIPFQNEGGKIIVQVRVNGSEPLAFWLDTGWEQVGLLKSNDPGKFNFNISDKDTSAAGSFHAKGPLAKGVKLQLGDLRLEGANLEISPKGGSGLISALPEDGILGGQFFKSVVVEINWSSGLVRLHDPSSFKAPESAVSVPLENRRGYIYASADVTSNGKSKTLKFIVDTGSTGSLLIRSDRLVLPENRLTDIVLGHSVFGPVKGDLGRIEGLDFGGSSMNGIVSYFLRESSYIMAVGADGNLGNEILRRFVVTFDYARERMLLEPTQAISEPFGFSTSGIATKRTISVDGSISIVDVYRDSPAALAGIAAGESIVSINSMSVSELGPMTVRKQLRQTAGTQIQLGIKNEESVRIVTIKLENIL